MTPLEQYRAAVKRTQRIERNLRGARAAEQAALQAAREAGCTLQAIADVRGLTRAGVAYLVKRQSCE